MFFKGGVFVKYFDTLNIAVENELIKRGVKTDNLLYLVKADLDGEGCFIDVYITFTKDTLYILSGYDVYGKNKKNRLIMPVTGFDFSDYKEIKISDIEKVHVLRYVTNAVLMIKEKNGKEYPAARFSIGFCDKFEKFSSRVNLTALNKPIDDSLLDEKNLRCPKCGEFYPDPNRPVCPRCTSRHSTFIRLVKLFGEYKLATAVIIIQFIISGALTIISPVFTTKMLYDDVLAVGGKYYGNVLMAVIASASVSLAGLITSSVGGIIGAKIIPKINESLRMKIYSSMQSQSLAYFTSKQTGSLMSRVDRDSGNVYWFFAGDAWYIVSQILSLIAIAVVMVIISPELSIGLIVFLGILEIIQVRFGKGQRKLYRKYDNAVRQANSVLSDAMNGKRVVKAFSGEEKENKRFKARNTESFVVNRKINDRLSAEVPIVGAVQSIINNAVIYLGYGMVIGGKILFGELSALINYSAITAEPINVLSWAGHRFAKCLDAASRMYEILDSVPTVREADNPVRLENIKGDIEFKNVSFEYDAGRPVIKNVSFKVESSHMFGIVGKTGAGKSTLINLIARLYDTTEGEILIDNVNVKKIAFEDLRRCIGVVSQETYMFMGTVADNIRYADKNASMEDVIEAAKAANAHEFITKLPAAYDTIIGERGVSLSGGEKQRISIARAIIQKPDVLILDEATAAMDTRTERRIQASIDKLKTGRTIISIAHRLSTLRDADMLCVIENGEVKEMGTHDELIRKKGEYYELYMLQADALRSINTDVKGEDDEMNTENVYIDESLYKTDNLKILDTDKLHFSPEESGLLTLEYEGKTYHKINPTRLLPQTEKDKFISICYENDDKEFFEVGVIKDINDFKDESQKKLVSDYLEFKYHMPEITKVYSIHDSMQGAIFVKCDTNCGSKTICVTDWNHNFKLRSGNYLYVNDADGNKFCCKDVYALDKKSIRVLENFL